MPRAARSRPIRADSKYSEDVPLMRTGVYSRLLSSLSTAHGNAFTGVATVFASTLAGCSTHEKASLSRFFLRDFTRYLRYR